MEDERILSEEDLHSLKIKLEKLVMTTRCEPSLFRQLFARESPPS